MSAHVKLGVVDAVQAGVGRAQLRLDAQVVHGTAVASCGCRHVVELQNAVTCERVCRESVHCSDAGSGPVSALTCKHV